ncbi:MAG: DUF58 domain-containing protein [Gammaproteobacteria bacterium]|nr:DUF58 domain-containing protein [Gammaproteobacteria bacterium]MDH5799757.1 DUF58 domain-containing protein [Gammaproteobacteria bacterium]
MTSGRAGNFQAAFRVDRWYRMHFTATGQLLIYAIVVSGVLGFDTSRNLSHQIFALLVAVLLLSMVFSRFSRPRIQCERSLPSVVTVGQAFNYQVRVHNRGSADYSDVLLVDRLEDVFPTAQELKRYNDRESRSENWFDRVVGYPRWRRLLRHKTGADAPRHIIDFLPAGQSVDLQLSMTPLRRGYVRIVSSCFAYPDPVGLFRKVFENPSEGSVLVLPKRYSVAPLKLSGKRNHHQGGVALSSSVGESGEFHGLREYENGDPLRRIHWRSWARQGKPMVKTYEDEFFVRHALVLDTCMTAGVANSPEAVFEEAVSVAASIAVNMTDQESLLDLMFVEDKAYQFTFGRGMGDTRSLLEILAGVQAGSEFSMTGLNALLAQHLSHMSSVIFVFLQWDEMRRQLVRNVRQNGIDVRVLLVCESSAAAPDVDFMSLDEPIITLTMESIEQDLLQLS